MGLPVGLARGRGLDGLPAMVPAIPPGPAPTAGDAPRQRTPLHPHAVPEIGGPGRITSAGRLWMKATNIGVMGNAYPALSSDPAAQWPGPSGVEYLYYWGLWVGAVRPGEADAGRRYRVSQATEWRPPTLDPVDRIYESYEGTPQGLREVDDDGDGRYDEEFLDGRDDDGDGAIDEDYAAIGQRTYTFSMSDDTPQATNANFAEQHLPLGLRVRQTVHSFTGPDVEDAAAVTYEITNAGTAVLDSVYVGFFVDPDVGPLAREGYWRDDRIEPAVPNQTLTEVIDREDPRYDPRTDPNHTGGFCVRSSISTRGFTVIDDDGDGGLSPGASTFLLLDHTTDLEFGTAPRTIAFRAKQFFLPGIPFTQGGPPSVDLERYDALAGGPCRRGICLDPESPDGRRVADWTALVSIGPFPRLVPGQRVFATVALSVFPVDHSAPARDPANPSVPNRARYGAVYDGALAIQKAYRGRYETPPPGTPVPPENGRETPVTAPRGTEIVVEDCHFNADSTGTGRTVTDHEIFWANFDNCDYCTGVKGKLPRRWRIELPPQGPNVRTTPGNRKVTIEWDNASEYVGDRTNAGLDPNAGKFDVRGYRVYRAAGWTRPRGTTGPAEDQWELLADLAVFDPYAPLWDSTDTDFDGVLDGVRPIAPVLLDRESGLRLVPADIAPLTDPASGDTIVSVGRRDAYDPTCRCVRVTADARVPHYPVGRYRYEDPEVANGFTYFYAVTAVDSTGAPGADGSAGTLRRRESARVAREADGVAPQAGAATASGGTEKKVFVVPNPYRGGASWDLEPSPTDPTGTHVDFLNLPPGAWTLRIFTVAGDLVQTIRPTDLQTNGKPQVETPEDGQASWNLISRNGQDVTSGIYLFSVAGGGATQRGSFVLIR